MLCDHPHSRSPRAKKLHNPCHLGGPQQQMQRQNQKWPLNPCPLGGPHVGKDSYITPAILGVPNAKRRDKIRIGYLTTTILGPTPY